MRQAILLATVGAAIAVGAAAAANSSGFVDPAGDAGDGPDLASVAVSSDDSGTITVRETVANRTTLSADDQVGFTLDVDQNPDTGSVLYGSELAIVLNGASPAVFRTGPSGYLTEEAPLPPSLRVVFVGGVATFSFAAADVGIASNGGFNISAQGFAPAGADTAPDIRTVNYQLVPGTPPPALGPDTRAPVDTAVASHGRRGKVAHLDFFTADGRAETADTIRVFRGKRVVKTIAYPLNDNNPFFEYYARWRVPKNARGAYHFCVRSTDRAGNKSNTDCAKIRITK